MFWNGNVKLLKMIFILFCNCTYCDILAKYSYNFSFKFQQQLAKHLMWFSCNFDIRRLKGKMAKCFHKHVLMWFICTFACQNTVGVKIKTSVIWKRYQTVNYNQHSLHISVRPIQSMKLLQLIYSLIFLFTNKKASNPH